MDKPQPGHGAARESIEVHRSFAPLAIGVCVLLAAGFGYLAYLHRPTERTALVTVEKPVWETRTADAPQIVIMPDGTIEPRMYTYEYKVAKTVPEQREISDPPTRLETIRFWVLVGVAIYYGAYATYVLIRWINNDIRRKTGKNAERIEAKLQSILSFAVGSLAGLLAAADLSPDLAKKAADAQIQADQSSIKANRELLIASFQQMERLTDLLESRVTTNEEETEPAVDVEPQPAQ